jgi:PAS domain S-box-containing protein
MKFDANPEQLDILREIAENLHDPVFLVDRNLNIWFYNTAFEMAVGVRMSSRKYKGKTCKELLGLEICETNCVMKKAAESMQNVRLAEIRAETIGGDKKNFHINAVPVVSSTGAAFGALIFLRDMTAETTVHEKYKSLIERNSAISLSGQIESGNLADVIQLFSFLQKSGKLGVKSQAGDQGGEIVFDRGKMVSIKVGETWSEKALGRMLSWDNGSFSFSAKIEGEIGELLDKPSDFVLMDALREKDESTARAGDIPASDVVLAAQPVPEGTELNPLEQQLLELAKTGATVAAAIEGIPEPDNRILLALLSLKGRKLLTW